MIQPKIQEVWTPIEVKNELSPIMKLVPTINNELKLSIHQRVTENEYQNDIIAYKELHDKNGYLNFGDESVEVTHWLKPQQGIFFTPEEFEAFKREFGKELLEKAAENAKTKDVGEMVYNYFNEGNDDPYWESKLVVNKKTITDILDDFLKENKL